MALTLWVRFGPDCQFHFGSGFRVGKMAEIAEKSNGFFDLQSMQVSHNKSSLRASFCCLKWQTSLAVDYISCSSLTISLRVTCPKAKLKLGCCLPYVLSAIWHLCSARDNFLKKGRKKKKISYVTVFLRVYCVILQVSKTKRGQTVLLMA